ncbi:cis-3-hydroxy-L-proline dehydratase-like [Sycon ciliatum]|uniref:cis-3-hydroxy-L-proline dehydratase-like n=1 Tax=Sycon ciliatum TaxID=27933 RepID=UPI0031F6EA57
MVVITKIEVFRVDLPLKEGRYAWARGKFVDVFDCTLVRISTDVGVHGIGEVTPLGPFYLPAYGPGAREGIRHMAPHLLGMDPTQLEVLNATMDEVLMGHNYCKSPIDMACWDIFGKLSKLPVCVLLGGRFTQTIPLYRTISQESPESMADKVAGYREEGYRKFQLKVGGDATLDKARIHAAVSKLDIAGGDTLVADANRGWLAEEATRVVRAVQDLDIYIEQPCNTYEECLKVRQRTRHPFVLDESIDSIEAFLRAHADQAMDAFNLKISKVGGLTRARQIRDLGARLGYAMTIEDSWGGDVVTAAISHLAASTPTRCLYASTDFNSYVTLSTATGAPQRRNGTMEASDQAGLGVELREDVIGQAVDVYGNA